MRQLYKTSLTFAVCSLPLFFLPSILGAVDWKMEPVLSLRGEYNDNLLFTTGKKMAVLGGTLTPSFTVNAVTRRLKVSGSVSVNVNRYTRESDLNTTDYIFRFSPSYEMERAEWKLNASYVRDSTLRTELLETGLALRRTQRNLLLVNPSWKGSITEYLSLEVEYRFSNVDYSGGEGGGLFDYRYHQGTTALFYDLTERDQISVRASYSNYNAPSLGFRSETYDAQGGWTHRFSESFQVSLSAGGFNTSQTGTEDQRRGLSLVGSAEKGFEKTNVNMSVSRRIIPSGSGSLLQGDRLSISVDRRFTADLSGSLSANLHKNRFLRKDISGQESRYYQIRPALRWRWADRWFFSASYNHSRQESDPGSRTATANAAYITLTYQWPKWVVSP